MDSAKHLVPPFKPSPNSHPYLLKISNHLNPPLAVTRSAPLRTLGIFIALGLIANISHTLLMVRLLTYQLNSTQLQIFDVLTLNGPTSFDLTSFRAGSPRIVTPFPFPMYIVPAGMHNFVSRLHSPQLVLQGVRLLLSHCVLAQERFLKTDHQTISRSSVWSNLVRCTHLNRRRLPTSGDFVARVLHTREHAYFCVQIAIAAAVFAWRQVVGGAFSVDTG